MVLEEKSSQIDNSFMSQYFGEAPMITKPILYSNDVRSFSQSIKEKRRYLDRIPLSEEDKQAILKHHINKAYTKNERIRKAIFEKTKIPHYAFDNPETKSKQGN